MQESTAEFKATSISRYPLHAAALKIARLCESSHSVILNADGHRRFSRMTKRSSESSAKDPFANDNSLTALPKYTRPRRGPGSLPSSLDKFNDAASDHTVRAPSPPLKAPPLRIPDAVYYLDGLASPSFSPSSTSEENAICHTGTSSTAFLLQQSPISPISSSNSSWDKPLPPVPASRPTSQLTIMSRELTLTVGGETLRSLPPAARPGSTLYPRNIDDDADAGESVYYTPMAHCVSLMSVDYQPSIPDIPGAWHSSDGRRKARPHYPF